MLSIAVGSNLARGEEISLRGRLNPRPTHVKALMKL